MVRPRLVEEGVPIGSTSSTSMGWNDYGDGDVMDHGMTMPVHREQTYSSTIRQHQPLPATTASLHNQAPLQQQSSLMRAAGGRFAHGLTSSRAAAVPTTKATTHFVIGGGMDNGSDHSMDDAQQHISESNCPISSNSQHAMHHSSSENHRHQVPHQNPWHYNHESKEPPRQGYHHHDHCAMPSLPVANRAATSTRTHIEIGADERVLEKMQGVEDHSVKEPLVVLDGANVAYAYAQALEELHIVSSSTVSHQRNRKMEPNMRGLRVAVDYFATSCRVLVVLPQSYYRRKPNPSSAIATMSSTSMFVQQDPEQLIVLEELQRQGRLVAAPPADDDDAYALSIARRENARAAQRRPHGTSSSAGSGSSIQGPAYVLSNDLFRDAQQRDVAGGTLVQWLVHGLSADLGPGRISFAFCDLGRLDDHGDPELDIVANPRHPLVQWIDEQHRANVASYS
jgi:Zc3h12a-like Ribonuclease NYN domain